METDASSDAQAEVSNQVHCGQNLEILSKNSEIQEPNFPQFICEICDVKFYNKLEFDTLHLNGKKHKKKLEMSQRQKVA